MELYLTLLSPVWWCTVVLCSGAFAVFAAWLSRRRPRGSAADQIELRARQLRLGTRVVALLVLANIAVFGTLAAANLRVPSLVGPVGMACLLCCLVSLALAVSLYGASTRIGRDEDRPTA